MRWNYNCDGKSVFYWNEQWIMEQLIRHYWGYTHEPQEKVVMKIKSPCLMRPDYIFFVEGFHSRALLILQRPLHSATIEQQSLPSRRTAKKLAYVTPAPWRPNYRTQQQNKVQPSRIRTTDTVVDIRHLNTAFGSALLRSLTQSSVVAA